MVFADAVPPLLVVNARYRLMFTSVVVTINPSPPNFEILPAQWTNARYRLGPSITWAAFRAVPRLRLYRRSGLLGVQLAEQVRLDGLDTSYLRRLDRFNEAQR